jgi:hypothetical protein
MLVACSKSSAGAYKSDNAIGGDHTVPLIPGNAAENVAREKGEVKVLDAVGPNAARAISR